MKFTKYLGLRLLTWALTIWIGVTFIFSSPAISIGSGGNNDWADSVPLRADGSLEMEMLRRSLRVQFGLDGSLWEQYLSFLWKGLLRFEFGPSLMSFPTPVGEIIRTYLPYTLVLTLTSTLLAWIIGNFIGLQAGFRKHKRSSKIMEGIAICIYPIPYFIVALVLQIVFAFILGWFLCKPRFSPLAGLRHSSVHSSGHRSCLPSHFCWWAQGGGLSP